MIISKNKKLAPHWRVIINSGLVVLCIILVVSIAELFRGMNLSIERLGYVRNAYNQASSQNADLNQEYKDLTTPDGVEYYVRNHYRAVSTGEELVVVIEPDEIIQAPVPQEVPFWERVRVFLHIP